MKIEKESLQQDSLEALLEKAKVKVASKKRYATIDNLVDILLEMVPQRTPLPYDWMELRPNVQFKYLYDNLAPSKKRMVNRLLKENSIRKGWLLTKWTADCGAEV